MDRRLLFWGALLFLLSLLVGSAVPLMPNARLALSAHVGGLMAGTFLVLEGIFFEQLALGPKALRVVRASSVFGFYGSTFAFVLGALLSTGQLTPINGAPPAAPWRELPVNVLLVSSAMAVDLALVLIVWGLRGSREELRIF